MKIGGDFVRASVSVWLAVTLSGISAEVCAEGSPSGSVPVSLATFPITVTAGDYVLTNQVVDLPPGSVVPQHSHGGPVVVTVIAGELTLLEAGGERTIKTGQSWTEEPGYTHSITNRTSENTRIAASYLIPKGAARITLIK